MEEFSSNPKICPQIHIPLQSGSTKILKKMKRGYSKEWFLDRCFKIKDMVKDVSISTDIIVGFPSETDEDFEDTMDVLEKVKFDQLFSFVYSPRPNTPASKYGKQVDIKIAKERLKRLQNRHDEIVDEVMASQIGKIVPVYFEELKSGRRVAGRSHNGKLVIVEGSQEYLGKIVDVKIIKSFRRFLEGKFWRL